ncbi:MAG: hypothetical protein ACO25M_12755 [Limnohabitans sp.]
MRQNLTVPKVLENCFSLITTSVCQRSVQSNSPRQLGPQAVALPLFNPGPFQASISSNTVERA